MLNGWLQPLQSSEHVLAHNVIYNLHNILDIHAHNPKIHIQTPPSVPQKQYLKTKDTKTYTDIRKSSNQLKHLTRKSAKEKERNISDKDKTNSRKTQKHKVPILNLYKYKAESKKDLAETDIDKADTLANQFSSAFTKESNTE